MLLDTNVLSELMRPAPATAVLRWLQSQRHEDLYTSAITVAELRAGVAVLPEGARRRDLNQRLTDLLHRAKERGWPVVTRNVADFEGCGLVLLNPWENGLQ